MIRKIIKNRRKINQQEARLIAVMGIPTFGLALSISVVITYAPLLAHKFVDSAFIIGLIIGAEGLIALFLPITIGNWSDHLKTRLGGRLPFVLAGGIVAALALLGVGLANSLSLLIVSIFGFFVGYYLAYEPYRALYPDLISKHATARAQGVQAMWRGAGTGVALTAGGSLIIIASWLPFVAAAAAVIISIVIFLILLLKQKGVPRQQHHEKETVVSSFTGLGKLLASHRQIRNFIVANALWELSVYALKTFIILYLTIGLGLTTGKAVLAIAFVAVFIAIGSPVSGILADHFGRLRVMTIAVAIFGICLLVPGFTANSWVMIAVAPIASLTGAVVMTLPYALLIPMMPPRKHGQLTGLYSTSRGIGIMLGPILAGSVISLNDQFFIANGYGAMWFVCSGAMLLSLFFLRKVRL